MVVNRFPGGALTECTLQIALTGRFFQAVVKEKCSGCRSNG